MPRGPDTQQVELAGRYWLASQLVHAGVEVAMPERDRGIDLIAYLDADPFSGKFVACPIQVKASNRSVFSLAPKYQKFAGLLLVYVWDLAEAGTTRCFALTYGEAYAIAARMGYTRTRSWRGQTSGPAGYVTTAPKPELCGLLATYEMTPERWPDTVRRCARKA